MSEDLDRNKYRIGNSITSRPPNNIERLPILASEYYTLEHDKFTWTNTLRELLTGVSDSTNILSKLQGHEQSLVRKIYSYVAHEYAKHVKLTIPAALVGNIYNDEIIRFSNRQHHWDPQHLEHRYPEFDLMGQGLPLKSCFPNDYVSFAICGNVSDKFPEPKNRNVNMMPFVYGDIESLPKDLRCYQQCIDACGISSEEKGKVYYLTVHESYVVPNQAQRREGLHIEAPGTIVEGGNAAFSAGEEHNWGVGVFMRPDVYEGGIYMASSVSGTSRVYDAIVDNAIPGIADKHGGCEHLRSIVGPGTDLDAGDLIWMTDRTPHEALPQEEAGMRQFFRLVTADISHWFAMHSTINPNVPLPDRVIVVEEDKFQEKIM